MAEAEGDEEEAEARRRGVSERLVAQRRAERGDASTSAVADDSSTEAEAIRSIKYRNCNFFSVSF